VQAAVIGLIANGPKAEASAVLIYLSTLYLEAYEIWRPCAVAHAAHAQGRPCRYHYIRECISDGVVDVDHVGTDDQLVDILTKALGRIRFVELRQRLGIVNVRQD